MSRSRRRLGRGRRGARSAGSAADGVSDDGVFTPLIDIFIAIVFFLMVTMRAGGGFVSVVPAVELPSSTGAPAEEELTVAVSPDRILLGGEPLMSVEEALGSARPSEPYLIPELHRSLREVREEISASLAEGESFRGTLAVQADRRIPYAVLSRILYSARKAGFRAFHLHVTEDEGRVAADGPPGGNLHASR